MSSILAGSVHRAVGCPWARVAADGAERRPAGSGRAVLARRPRPQLENRDPRFSAAPLLVSGTEAYVAGEYLYQDFLYDDYGSNTDGLGACRCRRGPATSTYPTNSARYGNNAADLVEFRIAVAPEPTSRTASH